MSYLMDEEALAEHLKLAKVNQATKHMYSYCGHGFGAVGTLEASMHAHAKRLTKPSGAELHMGRAANLPSNTDRSG